MANNVSTILGHREPLGYFQITSVAAAIGFPDIPEESSLAMIQPESQDIRWRDDGVDPTASVGMIIPAKDILFYTGKFDAIKFIEVTAGAKVNVTFY